MAIQIDWNRAEEIFPILLRAFDRRDHPYRKAFPPHAPAALPRTMPRGGKEHANFLFCCCYYMRGRIRSDSAILLLSSMYHRMPHLFDPSWVAQQETFDVEQTVRETFVAIGLGRNARENAKFWVANFQKLQKHWNGDIREVLRDVNSYEELCDRFMRSKKKNAPESHGFYGFRYKMTSMIIYFLIDSGLLEPFHFPVPVDFHVMRMSVSCEILTPEEGLHASSFIGNNALQTVARRLTAEFCRKHNVDPLRLCDALWHLSREGCARNLGNRSKKGKERGRRTEVTPYAITWKRRDIATYDSGCGRCPIKEYCKWNIPEAEYYVRGAITVRGERPVPPEEARGTQEELFAAAQ